MLRVVLQIFIAVMVLLSFREGFAQSERNSVTTVTTTRTERKATLSFEDELVEGGTAKPELFYLFQKKNFNYKRLIKLRENFLPEMRSSTEDIQRVRGGN